MQPIQPIERQQQPSRTTSPFAAPLVFVGLALGLIGDALLNIAPWGINVFLFVLVLMAVAWVFARRNAINLTGGGRWLAVPALAFAALYTLRDSNMLRALCLLAVLTALALIGVRAVAGRVRVASIMEYIAIFVSAFAQSSFGALPLLTQDADFHHMRLSSRSLRQLGSLLIGLFLALPLLLIFGVLFASADPNFGNLVWLLFDWDIQSLIKHMLVWGLLSWGAAGFLRLLFISGAARDTQAYANRPNLFTLGITEVAVVLGLLALMFGVFVALQFNYLFSLIPQSTNGALDPYSDFARRGFFELVTVAALLLPVLLAAYALLRKEQPNHVRLFRALAGLLVLFMFVIMASALQRMWLYTETFGLTELRVYTTAFMLWMGLVFAWFGCTVLVGKPNHFAFGAVCAGFLMIAALIAINPDDLIIRTNVARISLVGQGVANSVSAARVRGYDADYAVRLSFSADAVPALIESLPQIEEGDRCKIAIGIVNQWGAPEKFDWRTAHLARYRAWQAVSANMAALEKKCFESSAISKPTTSRPSPTPAPPIKNLPAAKPSTPEDEVLLHVFTPPTLSGTDQQIEALAEALAKLELALSDACAIKKSCYVLGSTSADTSETIFYLFGPSADRIITTIQPVVRSSALAANSFAVKRYAAQQKGEVIERLNP
jgi:hypothetical protein